MLLYPQSTQKPVLPKNIVPKDIYLFEQELERKIQATYLKKFENILVNNDFVLFSGTQIHPESFMNAPYLKNQNFIQKTKFLLKNYVFRKHKEFNTPAIWITDAWSNNYFHWLFDVVPRWWASLKLEQNYTILLPQSLEKFAFVREFLELIKANFVFIPKNEVWKIKELYFITHTAPTGNYNKLIIKELNQFFSEKNFEKNIDFGEKIYISRKNSAKRKILNETAVEKLVEQYGFRSLVLEDYDWFSKMSMLRKAQFLIGLHGAGLSNMLFMPPKSRILEIRRANDSQNNAFFSLANVLDFDYYYFLGTSQSQDTHTANLELDLEKFELCLKNFLI